MGLLRVFLAFLWVTHAYGGLLISGTAAPLTVGTIDSVSPGPNGLMVSGTTIYAQAASSTYPGLLNNGTQTVGGKKTVQTSSTNLVTIDPANPIGLNSGVNGILAVFSEVNGGSAVNITNTSAGNSATNFLGLGNDLANGKLGIGVTSSTFNGTIGRDIPGPDISAWISDSVGGSYIVNDQPGAPTCVNGGTGRVQLMCIAGSPGSSTGDFWLTGGHATEKFKLNPQTNTWFSQVRSVNNTIVTQIQNTNSGSNAYNQLVFSNDSGNGAGILQSSTTASFSLLDPDASAFYSTGTGGTIVWSQYGPLDFATGVGAGATKSASIPVTGGLFEKKGFARSYQRVNDTAAGSVTINDKTSVLVLTNGSTIATYTVTMPANPYDAQEVVITAAGIVTALTLNPNSGQTLLGGPSTITPSAALRYIWQATDTSWYRD